MELQGVESMPGATVHQLTRIWIRSLLEMVSGLQRAGAYRKVPGGKPNPLAVLVWLLMTLEYRRLLSRPSNSACSVS